MFSEEWKKVKVGAKLRRTSDDTIWLVFDMIDFAHYKVKSISDIQKGSPNILTISKKSTGWSPVLNSYEFSYTIKETIYAETEAEAKEIMKHRNEEYYIEGSDFELSTKKEILK